MLKTMKYEFRKNAYIPSIIGAIFVLAEIVFLLGMALTNDKLFVISVMVLFLLGSFGALYIFINGIYTYSRDLKDKSGYLVFMTPVSNYKIVGAKLLMILVETLVLFFVSLLTLTLDSMVYFTRYTGLTMQEIFDDIAAFFDFVSLEELFMSIAHIAVAVFVAFILFYMVVTLAYLAISLSATILQNKRAKGIVSFIFYLMLLFVTISIIDRMPGIYIATPDSTDGIQLFSYALLSELPTILFMVCVCVGAYLGTVKLLDKQISL